MELKLSIVVPVYEAEQYLSKCVESLLAQDLPPGAYEIILVDDGSPDRSGEICDRYAAQYSHIRTIHCENRGVGGARNNGVKVAQGKYVQFVDSDDFLEANVLNFLVDKMERDQLDILRFNYQNVNDQYEVFEPNQNRTSKPFVDYRDEVCDGLTFLTERLGYACYACQFVVKRVLLDGCLFREDVFFEDTEWTPSILLESKRVTSTNMVVYNYWIRNGSITRSNDMDRVMKVVNDMLLLLDFLRVQKLKATDPRWFDGMTAHLVLSLVSYVTIHCYDKKHMVIHELKNKRVLPLRCFHVTKNNFFKIQIMNISPNLLFCFMHLKNRKYGLRQ